MMNQIDLCDKVAYQHHVDGAIACVSCTDGGKWMVELIRVISFFFLGGISSPLLSLPLLSTPLLSLSSLLSLD